MQSSEAQEQYMLRLARSQDHGTLAELDSDSRDERLGEHGQVGMEGALLQTLLALIHPKCQ